MMLRPLLLVCTSLLTLTVADEINADLQRTKQNLELVSRQLMMQQYYVEEQTRNAGSSGVKRMRVDKQGTRPFYSASHADGGMLVSIHNHVNYDRMLGYGEMTAVLNGIEFRTRHNDYKLRMRRPNGPGKMDIPFPPVPPEVKQFEDVADQIQEMRKWFQAWKEQDYSDRDYRPYFPAVLCYLEGSWRHATQTSAVDEPFESDRHRIDASSWLDLTEKIRFTSYSGAKDSLENLAYLPTTIIKMENGTDPLLAQWNFEILCHPLSTDLPLNRLRAVDELKTRMEKTDGATMEKYESMRTARYQLGFSDKDTFVDQKGRWGLLDRLMEEIPGRDGYDGAISDTLFGDTVYQFKDNTKTVPLNVAYFHRWYAALKKGARGLKLRRRGYSDDNLFVSQTTDPTVAGLNLEHCIGKQCGNWAQKWTYAIPLEIVYMSPLSNWNPYNIPHRGTGGSTEGNKIHEGPNGNRNGNDSPDQAFNGTNTYKYFRTPNEFFLDPEDVDPADTGNEPVHVLDNNGVMHAVRASGFSVHTPEIPGVGILRQRYPIMPVHEEGSGVWKELSALTDIVLSPSKYSHMFRENLTTMCDGVSSKAPPSAGSSEWYKPGTSHYQFTTEEASPDWGQHVHFFELSTDQMLELDDGNLVSVTTDESHAHSHDMTLYKQDDSYRMGHCDCTNRCFDGHGLRVHLTGL